MVSKMGLTLKIHRIPKFVLVGITGAVVNLGAMWLLVEVFGLSDYFFKNLANIVSMETSIFYAFVFNRLWTWGDIPRKRGKKLILQFVLFNFSVLASVVVRILLFALIELIGLHYLINVTIGIGAGAIINFVFYDKIVFKGGGYYEPKSL